MIKVELDEEGGRAVWEVEAQDGAGDLEALVDAFTGEIVGQGSEDVEGAGQGGDDD
ncbi:PepSY domain-containing protein [Streptomyces sp. WAC04114]|uniref:PepSY domain-containing protein n=1 Tax=Streptomyces sp. WAC04114 TaxID=2867961 RepID=UPI001C8B3598|nr:PepSY domain-containing protein [Streptomyces sp. WAC04114]MBX9363856.1 PepSY domain-containing protein [Streptomyces sp. WAC04114]